MKNEIKNVLVLVKEMKEEEKKTVRVPHYYKRGGKMVERSYPDYVRTDRYNELFHGNGGIRGVNVFKCCECGKMVDYFALESWTCDFNRGEYVCSHCYEKEMGDDL